MKGAAAIAPSKVVPPTEDRWLSTKEAARYLGLRPSSLSALRIRGGGPPFSAALSRDPRYRLSDLQAFMETALVANTTQAKLKRETRTSL